MGEVGHRGVAAPVVPVKFERAPLPGRAIRRPRLIDALDRIDAPFTLVVAGPGYGKTVAVNQWLNDAEAPIAWVSLDASDDAPARFWQYVAESICRSTGGVGSEALEMLAAEQHPDLVVSALLADLWQFARPLIVGLDDVHVLRSPSLLAELAGFIERAPGNVRIVATSRVDPQLPLGRWRVAGRLGEVRQTDLQFSPDEATALFAARDLPEIEPADVALLTERTEGWAAGLHLAVLSLRGRSDAHEYIQSSLAGDRGIVDYLLGEVLDLLSEEDRDLVLDLSILEDFDADLAVAVSRRPDAGQQVRSLEARSFFLLPVDDRGERYRFHQLLRELLVAELHWRAPGRAGQLHARAAAQLESVGGYREAAHHLVEAGEVEQAFRLIVEPAWELLDRGDVLAARQWLDLLPDGVVASDVDRMLAYLVVLMAAGRVEEVDRWIAHLEATRSIQDLDVVQQVQLAAVRSFVEMLRGDNHLSQLSLLHCLDLLGGGELSGPVLDRLGGLIVRHAIEDQRYEAAEWWLAAVRQSQSSSLVVRELLPATLAASLSLATGRPREAERLARQVVEVADAQQLGPVAPAAEARLVLAEVLLERGQFVEAEEQAALAAELMAERRFTLLEFRARRIAVEASTARFGPVSGLRVVEASRNALAQRTVGAELRAALDALEGRLSLLTDDQARARRLVDQLPPGNQRILLEARCDLHARDVDRALAGLDRLAATTTAERIEALLLRSHAETGPPALAAVRSAAEIAVADERRHTFLREGPVIVRLARRAHQEEPTAALAALIADVAPARGPAGDAAFSEPLSERELALLELLPTHLTYREMADDLCVSINTVKTYQKAVFRKLDSSKRSDAVAAARRAGLLEPL